MNIVNIKTKLKDFCSRKPLRAKRESLENQYNYDICNMLENKPKNIEEINFKDYGWGYIVYTYYNMTENGRNYTFPFYIITKDNKFIRNGNDVSVKLSKEFISKTYIILRERFQNELKKESR